MPAVARTFGGGRGLCTLNAILGQAGVATRVACSSADSICHAMLLQETQAFDNEWRERVAAYEAAVAAQLTTLKATHEAQTAQFLLDCEIRRPSQPQHSAEYLNSRKIEEVLVKQVGYREPWPATWRCSATLH